MKKSEKYSIAGLVLAIISILILTLFKLNVAPPQAVLGLGSYNLYAYEDSFVDSTMPTQNFGNDLYTMISRDADYTYTYLKFSTPTIPAGSTLDSAMLYLRLSRCSGSTTLTPGRMGSAWNENTINWNNKPFATPYYNNSRPLNCNMNEAVLDLTSMVTAWMNGTPNNGVVVYGLNSGYYDFSFYSSESAPQTLTPKLVVEYNTPEVPPTPSPSQTTPSPTSLAAPKASAPSKSAKPAPVDTALDEPTFMYAMRNGQQVELGNDYLLEADTKDLVTIIGAGVPGNKIVLFVADKKYEYTVNGLGFWGITFEVKDLKVGNYRVEAQAQKDDKGSERVLMINLKRTDLLADVKELTKGAKGMDWLDRAGVIMFYLGPVLSFLFWIGVIVGIILIVKHHSKKKKAKLANQQLPQIVENQESKPQEPKKDISKKKK